MYNSRIDLNKKKTNYPGNDIPNQGFGNIATFQDCCNLCGANSGCTAFAYSTADRYCWLKSPSNYEL